MTDMKINNKYIYFLRTLSLVFCMVFTGSQIGWSSHIVGGSMSYRCLGNNNYEVRLDFRRDCFNGEDDAQFDDPATIWIFYGDGNLSPLGVGGRIRVNYNGDDTLNDIMTSTCQIIGTDVCVHTTTYIDTVQLPFSDRGYILSYERCCRNKTLNNIVDPETVGTTEWVFISSEAQEVCNEAPRFPEWPPVYICNEKPLIFDHSAFDSDGDSLVYSLCTPNTGATEDVPIPFNPTNPPFDVVTWQAPFGLDDVMGGVPLQIDSETGEITATPNILGQFLVGVCVSEFRDGKLLSIIRRDFEFNVRVCKEDPISSFEIDPNPNCGDLEVQFTNTSTPDVTYLWLFDFPNEEPSSTAENPSFEYAESGVYQVALISTEGTCMDTVVMDVGVSLEEDLEVDFTYEAVDCGQDVEIQFTNASVANLPIVAYDWTFSYDDQVFQSQEENPLVSVPSGIELTALLVVTIETGCFESLEQSFPVNSNLFTLVSGDGVDICIGTSTQLFTFTSDDAMFDWTPNESLDLTDPANPIATPMVTTTYYITASNGFCDQTDSIEVRVTDMQTVSILGDTTTCDGMVTLEGVAGIGAEFEWFTDAELTNSLGTDNPITVDLYADTSMYYAVLINSVCDGMSSTTVTLEEASIAISGGALNCAGDEFLVTLENLVPTNDLDIIWSEENLVAGQGTNMATYVFTDSGEMSVDVFVTNQFGCQDSAFLSTIVELYPEIALEDQTICFMSGVELYPGANPDYNYEWSTFDMDLLPDPNAPNPIINHLMVPTLFNVVVTNENGNCLVEDNMFVFIAEDINVTVSPNTILYCDGDIPSATAEITTPLNTDFEWFDSDGNMIFSGNPMVDIEVTPGEYTVIATSSDGCMDTTTFNFELFPDINLEVEFESVVLCDGADVSIDVTTDVDNVDFLWYDEDGNIVFEGDPLTIQLPNGTYTVIATDENNCTDQDQLMINIDEEIELMIEANVANNLYCEGNVVSLNAISDFDIDVTWFEGGEEIGTGLMIDVNPVDTVTYTAIAVNEFECSDTAMITLMPYLLDVTITNAPVFVCVNDTGLITIVNNDESQELSYNWTPLEGIVQGANADSVVISIFEDTTFEVLITNMAGCQWTEEVFVESSGFEIGEIEAEADPESILLGQTTELSTDQSPSLMHEWSPPETLDDPNSPTPIAAANLDGENIYVVTVTNDDGCTGTAQVSVNVRFPTCDENDVYIPNMFTPNDDDFNDRFRVESNFIDSLEMIVYNRWGEEVFKTTDPTGSWDGTYKGEALAPDVFGYWINVVCINGFRYTTQGNVSLMK